MSRVPFEMDQEDVDRDYDALFGTGVDGARNDDPPVPEPEHAKPRPESRVELAARLLIAALDRACPEWREDMDLFGGEPSAIDRAWAELLVAVDAVTEDNTRAPVFVFEESDPRVLIEGRLPGAQGLWIVFGKEAVGLMPDGFESGLCLSYPASIEVGRVLFSGDIAAGRQEEVPDADGPTREDAIKVVLRMRNALSDLVDENIDDEATLAMLDGSEFIVKYGRGET